MKNIIGLGIILALCSILGVVLCSGESEFGYKTRFSVKAIDENGKPMVGMPVWTCFSYQKPVEGKSDTNGLFSLEGTTAVPNVTYRIEKAGFYTSRGDYKFISQDEKKNIYLPCDPVVTTVVRKIVSPIPMYAKRVETRIPELNKPVAYDLSIGDWCKPFGKGIKTDISFTLSGDDKGFTNWQSSLVIVFPNSGKGIIRTLDDETSSDFALPRFAPESGYNQIWTNTAGYLPGKGFFTTQEGSVDEEYHRPWGYIFCIGVVTTNTDGSVSRNSFYGKMRGAIKFYNCNERTLCFTYYLNPTPNDRNLEFDPKRNLFRNLKVEQQVKAP